MQDRSGQLRAVLITFLVLGYVFVGLRCYVRVKFTKFGVDDFLALLSLVSPLVRNIKVKSLNRLQLVFTGLCADLFYGIDHGSLGKHIYDVPITTYSTGLEVLLKDDTNCPNNDH